jgi:hypothetical protein
MEGMKLTVIWVVTPGSSVIGSNISGERDVSILSQSSNLKMQAADPSETLVLIYQTTWRHNLRNYNFDKFRCPPKNNYDDNRWCPFLRLT